PSRRALRSLEIPAEVVELSPQFGDFGLQRRHPLAQSGTVIRRNRCWSRRLSFLGDFHIAGQQLRIPRFLKSRLPRELLDELHFTQTIQGGLDALQILELVQAIRTPAKLSQSLRPAQKQQAHDRRLSPPEVEFLGEPLPVLRNAHVAAGDAR